MKKFGLGLIHYSAFSAAKAMTEIRERDTIPYSYEWSQEIF